jgi:hypothetical protein
MGPSIDKRNASDRQKNIEINKKQLAVQASKQASLSSHTLLHRRLSVQQQRQQIVRQ